MNELQVFTYKGASVSFDFGNGQKMINATEMSKAFGKQPKDFLRSNQTRQFIEVLSGRTNRLPTDLVRVVNGGTRFGTWMHEKLALKFAAWLSPEFELWVYDRIHELLTTGKTELHSHLPDFSNPIAAARAWADSEEKRQMAIAERQSALQEAAHAREQSEVQAKELQRAKPKIEYHDEVLTSTNTYNTTQIANELNLSSVKLNRFLASKRVQYKQAGQWLLYVKYLGKGYTKTRTHKYDNSIGQPCTSMSTVWTEKGRKFIHELYASEQTDKS